MILSELTALTGVKRYQDLDLQRLIDVFTTKGGYEYLSRGRMAYAFRKPGKNEVLKVWASDAAYEHFVELAHKWQKNKHVPRFYTPVKELTVFHKRTSVMPTKLKWVRMEELYEADHFKLDGLTYSLELLTEELESHFSYDEDNLLEDVNSFLEQAEKEVKKPSGPELRFYAQTAMTLILEMAQQGAQPDFHSRNLLQRADGTAVITDPGGFGEEMTMSAFIRDLEHKHAIDPVGTKHHTGQTEYEIIKGPTKRSDYYSVADKLQ